MKEEGIPISEAANYDISSTGVLFPKKVTPTYLKDESEIQLSENLESSKTTEEMLAKIYKLHISEARANKEFMDKVFLTYLESTNRNLNAIKGWVSFFGLISILGAILIFLGIL
jgi:hypothetical protein